ncbi:MAG: hypothetical protein NTW17_01420 [Candidatus Pacearchaeota archaeon]|nr:hypothetical protein [Candidatus Pacearchaeota archaeon]
MGKSIKCFFGMHEWEKFMGLSNVGEARFRQRYKCRKCNKIKEIVR